MNQCDLVGKDNCGSAREGIPFPIDPNMVVETINVLARCSTYQELSEDTTCPYEEGLRELGVQMDVVFDQQIERSKTYGIEIVLSGNVVRPAGFSGIEANQWGDPVNYLWPLATPGQVEEAIAKLGPKDSDFADLYKDISSARVVWNRIIDKAQEYELDYHYDAQARPFDRLLDAELRLWAKGNTGVGIDDIGEARKALGEAQTVREVLAVQEAIAVASANKQQKDASGWNGLMREAEQRLEAVAKKQGLQLIEGSYTDKPQILERPDSEGNGEFLITGTFARVNVPTANGNVYPQSVWDANAEHIETMLANGKLIGQENHPSLFDWGTDIGKISTKFVSIYQDGDEMRYSAEVLDTEAGMNLRKLIDAGVGVEWSTRGFGSSEEVEDEEGNILNIVQDDYVLLAIDSVFDGAAVGTSTAKTESISRDMPSQSAVPPAKADNDVVEAQLPVKGARKEDEAMSKLNDVLRKLAESRALAGVYGATEAIDAIKEFEGKCEGIGDDEVEAVVKEGEELIDKAASLIEQAKKAADAAAEDDAKQRASLDERLAKLEAERAERERREKLEGIIETKVAEAKLPAEYEKRLRAALKDCKDEADVERVYASVQPTLAEAAEFVEKAKTVGVITRPDDVTRALTGEARPRPDTVAEVREQLVEGLINEGGVEDTGEDTPSNPVWVFNKILDNYQREFPHYLTTMTRSGYAQWRESTQSSDIAIGSPNVLPIFRRAYPQLIALELCSVQPISTPDAKVFFKNSLTDPGGARLDQSSNFDSTYADHTEGEAKAKIKMQVTSASISAVEKSLEASWTSVLAQDLMAYHGLDAESELLQDAADEIAREINYSILEDIRLNATGSTSRTFGTSAPSGYNGREWDQRLADFLSRTAGDIAALKYRNPDWLVCDPATAARFSALNTFAAATPDQEKTFGIDTVYEGVMANRWRVYSVGWFTSNVILMGYKGSDWKDTGYIYAPYIPTYVSPSAYNTSTNTASRSVNTRYATYMVDSQFFGYLTIQPGVTGTDLT